MTRILLILIAMFLLGILTWYCIRVESADIEADLSHRSLAALGYAGFDKLDVTVDGQDITLNGTVNSDDKRRLALAAVGNVWGVNSIHDNLMLRTDSSVTPTAPITSTTTPGNATDISQPPTTGDCGSALQELVGKRKLRFSLGSDELTEDSLPLLRDIAQLLQTCPNRVLIITGHTDSIGNADDNLALSRARATAVARELTRLGISSNRLQALGKGESDPIADNGTAAGREANRRISFEFQPESDTIRGKQ
jgi:outer membrane protein OmpA-like peptidoglycan-associated protein